MFYAYVCACLDIIMVWIGSNYGLVQYLAMVWTHQNMVRFCYVLECCNIFLYDHCHYRIVNGSELCVEGPCLLLFM
jgi:hypothetical protein